MPSPYEYSVPGVNAPSRSLLRSCSSTYTPEACKGPEFLVQTKAWIVLISLQIPRSRDQGLIGWDPRKSLPGIRGNSLWPRSSIGYAYLSCFQVRDVHISKTSGRNCSRLSHQGALSPGVVSSLGTKPRLRWMPKSGATSSFRFGPC